jgi:hypothetical protein
MFSLILVLYSETTQWNQSASLNQNKIYKSYNGVDAMLEKYEKWVEAWNNTIE